MPGRAPSPRLAGPRRQTACWKNGEGRRRSHLDSTRAPHSLVGLEARVLQPFVGVPPKEARRQQRERGKVRRGLSATRRARGRLLGSSSWGLPIVFSVEMGRGRWSAGSRGTPPSPPVQRCRPTRGPCPVAAVCNFAQCSQRTGQLVLIIRAACWCCCLTCFWDSQEMPTKRSVVLGGVWEAVWAGATRQAARSCALLRPTRLRKRRASRFRRVTPGGDRQRPPLVRPPVASLKSPTAAGPLTNRKLIPFIRGATHPSPAHARSTAAATPNSVQTNKYPPSSRVS